MIYEDKPYSESELWCNILLTPLWDQCLPRKLVKCLFCGLKHSQLGKSLSGMAEALANLKTGKKRIIHPH